MWCCCVLWLLSLHFDLSFLPVSLQELALLSTMKLLRLCTCSLWTYAATHVLVSCCILLTVLYRLYKLNLCMRNSIVHVLIKAFLIECMLCLCTFASHFCTVALLHLVLSWHVYYLWRNVCPLVPHCTLTVVVYRSKYIADTPLNCDAKWYLSLAFRYASSVHGVSATFAKGIK